MVRYVDVVIKKEKLKKFVRKLIEFVLIIEGEVEDEVLVLLECKYIIDSLFL